MSAVVVLLIAIFSELDTSITQFSIIFVPEQILYGTANNENTFNDDCWLFYCFTWFTVMQQTAPHRTHRIRNFPFKSHCHLMFAFDLNFNCTHSLCTQNQYMQNNKGKTKRKKITEEMYVKWRCNIRV